MSDARRAEQSARDRADAAGRKLSRLQQRHELVMFLWIMHHHALRSDWQCTNSSPRKLRPHTATGPLPKISRRYPQAMIFLKVHGVEISLLSRETILALLSHLCPHLFLVGTGVVDEVDEDSEEEAGVEVGVVVEVGISFKVRSRLFF